MNTAHEGTNRGGTLSCQSATRTLSRPAVSQDAGRNRTAMGGGLMAQVAGRWRIKTRSATHSNTLPQGEIPHGWQMWQVLPKLTHTKNSNRTPRKGEKAGTWALHRGKPATSATLTPRPGMSRKVLA